MRIGAISSVPNRHLNNYGQKVQHPNFKSGGGAWGTVVGCGIGVGLTVLTGGAAIGLIPLMGFGGAVTGEAVKEKIDENKKDHNK